MLICIGYQCVELYHAEHGITVPFDDFKAWAKESAELATHDGDVDYISLLAGSYNEYMSSKATA